MGYTLHHGDCLDVLPVMPDSSIDCVVTDPPSGAGFMGKSWDKADILGVGRGRAMPSTARAKDRGAFVGFLSSALAECLRIAKPGSILFCWALPRTSHWTGTAIEDAGWIIEDRIAHIHGQGYPKHKSKLKPSVEDWWLARKPGPKWLGVDRCRIKGRWPANVCFSHCHQCIKTIHDGSEVSWDCHESCPVRLIGEQGGERTSGKQSPGGHVRISNKTKNCYGAFAGRKNEGDVLYGDSGSAARFFANFTADPFVYLAKASPSDRGPTNGHPTVKSTQLMRWLCRLACPPGGLILDPFMGSGSTGIAAIAEGFAFVGVERDGAYYRIARGRIEDTYPLFATMET